MGWFSITAPFSILCVLLPPQAQSLVVGSPRIIFSAPGDDVMLRCHLEPPVDIQGLTVEWSRPDLQPDPSDPLRRVQYVHVYRNRGEVTDMKLWSYAGRTELFTDQLRHGNISLRILNVTLEDAATYRCFIPKLKSPVREATVQLVVDANFLKTTLTPRKQEEQNMTNANAGGRRSTNVLIPVTVITLSGLLLIILIGACLYRRQHKNQSLTDLHQPGHNDDQQRSGLLGGTGPAEQSRREEDLT